MLPSYYYDSFEGAASLQALYMTMPTPYLKVEKSETAADPLAVNVTLGAMSLMKEGGKRHLLHCTWP